MKIYIFLFTFLMGVPSVTFACITCDRNIQQGIYNSAFYINILSILFPFVVLGLVVAGLSMLANRKYRIVQTKYPDQIILNAAPLTAAATILGIGIGGFIDGIFLHQILQWHEMISNRLPPVNYINKSINMFWDGIFHTGTLIITLIGIIQLWKLLPRPDIDRSSRLLVGGMLLGWGLFNLIEGTIDHHILKLHNVKEITANVAGWNIGFLGFSVVLIVVGFWLTRHQSKPAIKT
ncbi:MAG: DUF2243 domain-containing protein [Saprospiraceae bacterium]